MAKNKSSFVMYADQGPLFEQLPDDVAGKLIKIIFQYVGDKNPTVDDLLLKIAFEPIKRQLKRDLKDWEQKRKKRSEAGKKGGISSGKSRANEAMLHFASKNEANEAVTVTVTDTVTVNGNVPKGNRRTNVLVGQVADAMSDDSLKKNYRELVNSLSGKTSSEIWVALKEFVKKERPAFFDPYLDLWNIFAIRAGLIKEPQRSTDKRLNKFRTRIRESGFDFLKILEKIQASGFLKGSNEKGWKVSIEFILDSQENYTKILEGKYETQ